MFEPGSFRIMVTDANHRIRDFLKRELEQEGYTVACISSGVEAYNCIRDANCFDLVILDPELLVPYDHSLLWKVIKQNGPPRIIIHAYADFLPELKSSDTLRIVEKNASSIAVLKEEVRRCYSLMEGT